MDGLKKRCDEVGVHLVLWEAFKETTSFQTANRLTRRKLTHEWQAVKVMSFKRDDNTNYLTPHQSYELGLHSYRNKWTLSEWF